MSKSRMTTWVGRSAIILALPVLAGCSSFGCRLSGGTASGCYSGPGTDVLIVTAVVVATPFVLASEGIDSAKKWVDGLGKPDPELVQEYEAACESKRWPQALEYTQKFDKKGWGINRKCQVEALISLGRLDEAAPLARRLESSPFRCEALVRTNQPAWAQEACISVVLQEPYKPTRWAMLGHSYLLQGQVEQAYTQYRRMLNHDLDFIKGNYHGDCDRFGDRYGTGRVAGLNPLLELFGQQGWHAEASTQAKTYVHDLYCTVGAAYRLQSRAAESQDPAERAALQQQADAKATAVLSGDDLAIVRNRLQHLLLKPLTEKLGPDYERALAEDIKLDREWSAIEARQNQTLRPASAPAATDTGK